MGTLSKALPNSIVKAQNPLTYGNHYVCSAVYLTQLFLLPSPKEGIFEALQLPYFTRSTWWQVKLRSNPEKQGPGQQLQEHRGIPSQDGSLGGKLFQIRKAHTFLFGFCFRQRFNDSDVLGSQVEHIVLLSPFQKSKDYWPHRSVGCVEISRPECGRDGNTRQAKIYAMHLCSLCFKSGPYSSAPGVQVTPRLLEEQVATFPILTVATDVRTYPYCILGIISPTLL